MCVCILLKHDFYTKNEILKSNLNKEINFCLFYLKTPMY